jgi:hypothetical protein
MEFIIVEKPIFLTGLVKRGDAPGRLRRMLKASREDWNGAVLIAVRGWGSIAAVPRVSQHVALVNSRTPLMIPLSH